MIKRYRTEVRTISFADRGMSRQIVDVQHGKLWMSRIAAHGRCGGRTLTVEIETGRQLRRRLTVDRRYWRMCDDFVAALAIPRALFAEAARLGKPTHADGISELWWPRT